MTALAQTLLRNGKRVTVWNRTLSKAERLVQQGAVLASSAASAISASPITIVCVANYETSARILDTKEVAPVGGSQASGEGHPDGAFRKPRKLS
nr:NAD(P)-binding domain-containing protein [Paenibacillus sp. A3]